MAGPRHHARFGLATHRPAPPGFRAGFFARLTVAGVVARPADVSKTRKTKTITLSLVSVPRTDLRGHTCGGLDAALEHARALEVAWTHREALAALAVQAQLGLLDGTGVDSRTLAVRLQQSGYDELERAGYQRWISQCDGKTEHRVLEPGATPGSYSGEVWRKAPLRTPSFRLTDTEQVDPRPLAIPNNVVLLFGVRELLVPDGPQLWLAFHGLGVNRKAEIITCVGVVSGAFVVATLTAAELLLPLPLDQCNALTVSTVVSTSSDGRLVATASLPLGNSRIG